jgi:ribosomal RNA-processing protein 12
MSAAPPSLTIEDALSKLRPHTSSKLPHQKKPALLLKALESSLPEPITPTAYYAALVQTVQQAVTKDLSSSDDGELQVGEGDLVPAVLYLLSTVIDFVPPAVYHAQNELGLLGPLFSSASLPESSESQSLLSLFAPCSTSAPSLRSLIHILQQLLLSAPTLALTTNPYVSTLNTLLSVSLDSRPRVRKMAQEAVRDVLAAPPPPAVRHPYAERVAKWLVKVLSERVRSDEGEQRRIWAVGFVRIVAASWPSDVRSDIPLHVLDSFYSSLD